MAWTLHSKRTKRLLKQATEQAKTAVNELRPYRAATRKATGHASKPIAHFSLVKALLWAQPHLARAVILADVSHGAQTDVASCASYQGAC